MRKFGTIIPDGMKWSKTDSKNQNNDNSSNSTTNIQTKSTISSLTNALVLASSYRNQQDLVEQQRKYFESHIQNLEQEILSLQKSDFEDGFGMPNSPSNENQSGSNSQPKLLNLPKPQALANNNDIEKPKDDAEDDTSNKNINDIIWNKKMLIMMKVMKIVM